MAIKKKLVGALSPSPLTGQSIPEHYYTSRHSRPWCSVEIGGAPGIPHSDLSPPPLAASHAEQHFRDIVDHSKDQWPHSPYDCTGGPISIVPPLGPSAAGEPEAWMKLHRAGGRSQFESSTGVMAPYLA